MTAVVVIDPDDAIERALRGVPHVVVDERDALADVRASDNDVRVVVLGPGRDESITTAQRVCAARRAVAIVVVEKQDRVQSLREAARFAPYLGDVECVANDVASIERAVRAALVRANARATFSRTLQGLDARLAQAATTSRPFLASDVLSRLVENAPVGFVLIDDDGIIRTWNPRSAIIFGINERDAIGTAFRALLPEAQLTAWDDVRARARATGAASATFEREGLPGAHHVEIHAAELIGSRGERGHIVIASDVTIIVEAMRRLEEAVRIRDDFLVLASHELRTPLAAIQLTAESLESRITEDSPLRTPFARLRRQASRLRGLVDDLVDVSRLAHGTYRLELQTVDLGALVREVIEQLRDDGVITPTGSRIELELADGVLGEWDVSALHRIVSNLTSNAVKYGRGRPVRIHTERAGDEAILRVTDEGLGIPAEARDRIFGKFERAVSVRNYGGLGLGLFIARSVVQALSGSIDFESTLNEGTTFVVRLPLRGPIAS